MVRCAKGSRSHLGRQAVTDPTSFDSLAAQAEIYDQVLDELRKGRKRTHWMWFVFPQLAGLARSATANHYALRDLDQAKRYLADPLLGNRLRDAVRLMLKHKGKSAFEILGFPRAMI